MVRLVSVALSVLGLAGVAAAQTPLPVIDFRDPAAARAWEPAHDVAGLDCDAAGLVVRIGGSDPYLLGPRCDFPPEVPLWAELELRSETGGMAQLFWFARGAREEDSVRFTVPKDRWYTARLRVPALGRGFGLRIDPPGVSGTTILRALRFVPRVALAAPSWPKPEPPVLPVDALEVGAGGVTLRHARDAWGAFELRVGNHRMAVGHTRPLLGYLVDGRLRWLDVAARATVRAVMRQERELTVTLDVADEDGAAWRFVRRIRAAADGDAVEIDTLVASDRERKVVHLPMLQLFAGVGSFGERKGQALLPGLEYLADEPSSSEKDVTGPAARRQVPDSLKLTFPLMALQADERWIALAWQPAPEFAVLFDSPDRIFGSGGHVMGVLFPGSNAEDRDEGSLLPHDGVVLAAGRPLVLRATLCGGAGRSVVPAIEAWVKRNGLPPVPPVPAPVDFWRLAARGWLDSGIRDGSRFRHAVGGAQFGPHPAADAAAFLAWLAGQLPEADLAARATEAARQAIAEVAPAHYLTAAVSHVRPPVVPLLFGHVVESVEAARRETRALLDRFADDGTVSYRPREGGPDLGRTHLAPHANGLTAGVVASLLASAAYCGDEALIAQGIARLRELDRYRDSVPRGAQTWEVPLHTPDILAAAHLVHAYLLGYELTGERGFLESARAWAWTGLPFVYLVPPTDGEVGVYGTIAVFGATHWRAPVWMGLPVQWCGLVYADAVRRLARHDAGRMWERVADGITASGIQQTWGEDGGELVGLLPDSFALRAQHRQGPAINPGTVQANAIALYRGPDLYDYRVIGGLRVHAPGRIVPVQVDEARVVLRVQGWSPRRWFLLVTGLTGEPQVTVDGAPVPLVSPHSFDRATGVLVLALTGQPTVVLQR